MDKNYVFNRQQYSTSALNQDTTDVESYVKQILKDWHPDSDEKVMTGLLVTAESPPSLTVAISSGYGYQTQDIVIVPAPTTYTFQSTDIATIPPGQSRIDRIYLEYASAFDPSSLVNVEFFRSDGTIETRAIYQRKMDYYELQKATGTPSGGMPIPPVLPDTALKLAQIALAFSASSISSGDITDERVL